ncbi:YidC/Oxa1 family insertase periplasmic-domain containing protein, partial [Leifsonia sp. SIMBA_070]|uniref:YidC/Oxa1 family insertase periplasmic-domain containing protein n=1 Tax=Leifsonia sp. SIMBA_070 TaxID=3085810 RepID=UPI003979308B
MTSAIPSRSRALGSWLNTIIPITVAVAGRSEGALAIVDGTLVQRKFGKLENGEGAEESGTGGWVGITQRYWMAAA